ncbi:MAG: phage tail protein, partial [Clostridiales bacterium]|nr:phage tail protein [Clostridiales bacterium]
MYQITYVHKDETEERTLYLPGDNDYCLTAAALSLEVGAAGELSVSIPDTNLAKADFDCLTDEIIVYRDGAELWRGRAITRQEDFYRTGTLTCEGVLAYLYDTYYPPFTFSGSPTDFLQAVLDNHNAQVEERKQLQLGTVTVEDSNDYISRSSIEYNRTLTVLTDKLINDSLGGYFRVRIVDGVKYLDYLASYGTTATQPVEFGVNLLDIAQNVTYSDLATVILPLGAKLEDSDGNQTDEYLTISDVNNGSIYYADEAAVEKYGWIVVCNIWEDVTEASNLLTKAKNYLAQVTSAVTSFEVNAVDLALVSAEYEYINLGDYVLIQSEPHGVDQYVELTAMDIDLLDPSNDTLTFGTDTASLTDAQRSSDRSVQTALESLSVQYTNLVATAITTKYLAANYLNADTIRADYLTAKDIAANYASIDLANVSTANIGTLFANVGLLTNMSVVDGYITGTLNGVTINADVITTGTLSVDRLLLTGEDGIIYAINASSSGLTESELSAEQYQNYINGSCIVANSVTAAQINVTDLFAQDITATGSITGLALYSINGAFSLDADGKLVSTSGQIGGWTIDNYRLYAELTTLETTTETVYVTDEDGNYIQETDDEGNLLYYTDSTESETTTEETDYPVYQTETEDVTIATGYDSYTILNALKSSSSDIAISIGAANLEDPTTGAIKLCNNGNIYAHKLFLNNGSSEPKVEFSRDLDTGTIYGRMYLTYISNTAPRIAFAVQGVGDSSMNYSVSITKEGIIPYTNGRTSCGTSAIRWSNVYTKALDVSGNGTVSGNIQFANGHSIVCADNTGTYRSIAYINSSNNYLFGAGSVTSTIYLGTTTYTSNIYLRAKDSIYAGPKSIRVPEIQKGAVSITPSKANTPTGVAVTFGSTFSGTPHVHTQATVSVIGTTVSGTS